MKEIKSRRKLMEIMDDINTAIEMAIEEAHDSEDWDGEWDGEISLDIQSILDELEIEREEKLDGVIRYAKELVRDVKNLKEEKKAIDKRIKTKENKIDGIKQFIAYATNGQKFESTGGVVNYRNSSSVIFSSEVEEAIADGEIPKGFEDFAVVEQVVKVPKNSVKSWLKEDENNKLDGAEIVVKRSVIVK